MEKGFSWPQIRVMELGTKRWWTEQKARHQDTEKEEDEQDLPSPQPGEIFALCAGVCGHMQVAIA